jgi:predicted HTH domain antitoxin
MRLEIEVNVADGTSDKTQLQEHLRKEAILALFADRKIPAGQATRELGLTRLAFMDLCQKRGIPLHDYTLEDFEQDIKTLDSLWPEIEKNVRDSGARRIESLAPHLPVGAWRPGTSPYSSRRNCHP